MSLKTAAVILFGVSLFCTVSVKNTRSHSIHAKWKCEHICSSYGGKFQLNRDNKICKCSIDGSVDNAEIAVMQKEALMSGLTLKIATRNNPRGKREIPENGAEIVEDVAAPATTLIPSTEPQATTPSELNKEPPLTTPIIPLNSTTQEVTLEKNLEDKASIKLHGKDSIVGQTLKRLPPRRNHVHKPITLDQHQIIVQQMRDHLNRLSQITAPVARQAEIDAIRHNLKQLTHRVLVPNVSTRLKGLGDYSKLRLRPNLLGATQDPLVTAEEMRHTSKTEVNDAIKEIFKRPNPYPRLELITQDPNLIDV